MICSFSFVSEEDRRDSFKFDKLDEWMEFVVQHVLMSSAAVPLWSAFISTHEIMQGGVIGHWGRGENTELLLLPTFWNTLWETFVHSSGVLIEQNCER